MNFLTFERKWLKIQNPDPFLVLIKMMFHNSKARKECVSFCWEGWLVSLSQDWSCVDRRCSNVLMMNTDIEYYYIRSITERKMLSFDHWWSEFLSWEWQQRSKTTMNFNIVQINKQGSLAVITFLWSQLQDHTSSISPRQSCQLVLLPMKSHDYTKESDIPYGAFTHLWCCWATCFAYKSPNVKIGHDWTFGRDKYGFLKYTTLHGVIRGTLKWKKMCPDKKMGES